MTHSTLHHIVVFPSETVAKITKRTVVESIQNDKERFLDRIGTGGSHGPHFDNVGVPNDREKARFHGQVDDAVHVRLRILPARILQLLERVPATFVLIVALIVVVVVPPQAVHFHKASILHNVVNGVFVVQVKIRQRRTISAITACFQCNLGDFVDDAKATATQDASQREFCKKGRKECAYYAGNVWFVVRFAFAAIG